MRRVVTQGVLAASLALAGGCTGTVEPSRTFAQSAFPGITARTTPVRTRDNATSRVDPAALRKTSARFVREGSGTFVSKRAPNAARIDVSDDGQEYTLALDDAPVAVAADTVLGETLGVPFAVDPAVTGTVTLQTAGYVSRSDLLDVFETALAVVGAAIVERGGVYRIVPASAALASTPAISVPRMGRRGPGVKIHVIELQNISAAEMRTILEPITKAGSILRADENKNYIMVAGNDVELAAIRDAVGLFDVDAFRGQSVGMFPLKSSAPDAVAKELEAVFRSSGVDEKLIRFLPNRRLNAILVVSPRQKHLRRAEELIAQLDRVANTSEEQLFVYRIQNRPAKELAAVLQSVLSTGSTTRVAASEGAIAPDLTPVTVGERRVGEDGPSVVEVNVAERGPRVPSIVADTENNALLISTSPRSYERIERILRQLDTHPTQVLIEAVIAEVSLTDELKFGVRFAIEEGNFKFGLSDLVSGAANAAFPGFSSVFNTPDVKVAINALNSVTDVKVVSAPTLMALNNQTATLQVGDQVPIVTQQTAGVVAGNAPVINSVQLKDTGIILKVTPRVSSTGRVLLEIEQEVSSVVRTTTSGIDSPTIQQRKIATRVVVDDGESLALGGLIQERDTLSRGKVPILGSAPVIGNLFKNKTDTIKRTELLIFIRPRVVRDAHEARRVTDEFRETLQMRSAIDKRRGGTRLQQNFKRLAY